MISVAAASRWWVMKFDGMDFQVCRSFGGREKRTSFTVQKDIPLSSSLPQVKEKDFYLRSYETCPVSIKAKYEMTLPKRRIINTRKLPDNRLWASGDLVCEGWEPEQRVNTDTCLTGLVKSGQ